MSKSPYIDSIIDHYVDNFSQELTLSLLKILSVPSQGGLGYTLETFNPLIDMDGWEVDRINKKIKLDTSSIFSKYSISDLANHLKAAVETEFIKNRASLLSRIGWGTGKVVIGIIETGIGAIGIIVPEPGTTVAGVGMAVLGTNTIADGFSQLAGYNKNNGYNLLGVSIWKSGFYCCGYCRL